MCTEPASPYATGCPHAAAERQRVLRPGVVGAQRPDARQLIVSHRYPTLGEVVLAMTAQGEVLAITGVGGTGLEPVTSCL